MTNDFGRYQLLMDIDGGEVSADDLSLTVDLPSGVLGVAYVGAYIGHDGVPPYSYTTSTGSLPTGLSLNGSTGAVTGTPTSLGANNGYFEFTASVTDSAGSPVTKSKVVSIKIGSGIVIAQAMPPAEVGIAYAGLVSASGGTAPYTYTIPSGSLPTGLSINSSSGLITGTPTVPGTFNFTVRATDSASVPQDLPTSITVAPAVDLSTSNYADGIVGIVYSAGPTRTGGVAPFTYSITSGTIPAGTNFDPRSGFVTGTPTTAATYNFDVTVLDVIGGTDTFSATVVISPSGGTGAGIQTINTVTPDGGGNFGLASSDGSVTFASGTHALDVKATHGVQINFARGLGFIQPGDYATINKTLSALNFAAYVATAKQSGSIAIDVRVSSNPAVRPTSGDSITAGNYLVISGSDHNAASITGWTTTAIVAGRRVEFYVISCSAISDTTFEVTQ